MYMTVSRVVASDKPMNNNKGRTTQKTAFLELSFADGSKLQGKIFVPIQGRLTDVLNDDRQFLPVETASGELLAIAKSSIKHVTIPGSEAAIYKGNDPYTVLGVKEGVSSDELKRVYHKLSKANHPDLIKSFGLGADFQQLATQNMARINNAYEQLSKNSTN